MSGTVKLGETPVTYHTATMEQQAPIQDRKSKVAPVYKNYNQKVDIISGRVLDHNTKSFGFERYTDTSQAL